MRILSATILSAALLTAADPAPLAELRVADGKELIAHWQATPIGRTWTDPALKPLRDQWDDIERKNLETHGATVIGTLASLTKISGVVFPAPGPIPQVRMTVDAGALATPLMAKLTKESGLGPKTVAGADEAVGNEHLLLARFGTTLVGTDAGSVPKVVAPGPVTGDVHGVLHVAATVAWLKQLPVANQDANRLIHQMITAWEAQQVTTADYRATVVPEGVLEVLRSDGRPSPGGQPVDRALLARLSATTVAAVGVGLDLSAAWAAQRTQLLAQWAPMVGRDPADVDAVEAEINRVLTTLGLPVTMAQLAETKGTLVVALSPGMPVPGITIWLPRSPAIDQLVAVALTKAQVAAPAEGTGTPVFIPGVPLPLTLARDAGHWSITTDAQESDAFLAAKSGGWADSAAWKLALSRAPTDAPVIGASDTPALARLVSGAVGMALGMQRQGDPAVRQAILQGLVRLAKEASTGYVVAGTRDHQQVVEVRSLTGLAALPVGGGLIGMSMANRHATAPAAKKPAAGEAAKKPAADQKDKESF